MSQILSWKLITEMIITKLVPVIGSVAAEAATVFSVILYILATKKTVVILTFSNAEDEIECKVGANIVIHFLLKNTGNIAAHNIEALIYYPKGLQPHAQNITQPEKVQYFMNPERMVLRVEDLAPRSNPVSRHTSCVKTDKLASHEFEYETTGDKVKEKKGG